MKNEILQQHSLGLGANDMLEAAFNFWYSDKEHIRSPFPEYIRESLRMKAIDKFFDWVNKSAEKAKKEINDEIVAEKFEEILFETALPMVLTEDERLTIRYPFMMRMGDVVSVKEIPEVETSNEVIDRSFLKRGDFAYMKVKLKNTSTGKVWEREFELPE
ncbi:MAG: hypothetical protein EPN85_09150 [Bacteroidetes bacterium]|nr:MAG: hypothetical protein EPN85_09150 [Bacteroidota bacterium]